jgi:hypothetical protein
MASYPPPPVIEGSVGIIEMLLAKGANPNARLKGPILKRVCTTPETIASGKAP